MNPNDFVLSKENHTWKISFKYSPERVEAVKSLPGRKYSPKDKAWFVPDCVTTRVFIKHYLGKDLNHIDYDLPAPVKDEMPFVYQKPYRHQEEAIQQIVSCISESKGMGVFAETGTGKTKMVLESIRRFPNNKFLVVAPAPLLKVWETQAVNHKINCHVFHGLNRMKKIDCLKENQLIITSYQTFVNDFEFWKVFKFSAVFCDESHLLKSNSAQRTKAIKQLKEVGCKILLTGTPYGNKLEDVYTQVNISNPESFGPRRVFHNSFCIFGGWEDKEVVDYKNLNIFYEILRRSSLVIRKKDCLDLPEKTYQCIPIKMGVKQTQAYKRAQAGAVADMPITSVLAKIMKLRQISSGFVYGEEEEIFKFENPKLEYLASISWSEPTIIWCNFVEEEENIKALLENMGVRLAVVDGAVSAHKKVSDFESGKADVILANLASIQYGHTLNRASRVIYFSPSFSQLQRSQSEDRCHRIGQNQKVTYIDLVSSPVEEWILEAQKSKIEIKDYVLKKLVDNETK